MRPLFPEGILRKVNILPLRTCMALQKAPRAKYPDEINRLLWLSPLLERRAQPEVEKSVNLVPQISPLAPLGRNDKNIARPE